MNDHIKETKTESFDKPVDNGTFNQDLVEMNKEDNTSSESPSERGEDSVGGSTPDLESDDDTLKNAHRMGIAPQADLENPKELNISKDLDDAEKHRGAH